MRRRHKATRLPRTSKCSRRSCYSDPVHYSQLVRPVVFLVFRYDTTDISNMPPVAASRITSAPLGPARLIEEIRHFVVWRGGRPRPPPGRSHRVPQRPRGTHGIRRGGQLIIPGSAFQREGAEGRALGRVLVPAALAQADDELRCVGREVRAERWLARRVRDSLENLLERKKPTRGSPCAAPAAREKSQRSIFQLSCFNSRQAGVGRLRLLPLLVPGVPSRTSRLPGYLRTGPSRCRARTRECQNCTLLEMEKAAVT